MEDRDPRSLFPISCSIWRRRKKGEERLICLYNCAKRNIGLLADGINKYNIKHPLTILFCVNFSFSNNYASRAKPINGRIVESGRCNVPKQSHRKQAIIIFLHASSQIPTFFSRIYYIHAHIKLVFVHTYLQ